MGQLLLHGLLVLEPGLAHVVQRGADHQIGQAHVALHVGERAVAVQRGADVARRARVAVEEDVLPGDLDVVEHEQRVDLVEAVRDRIVGGRRAAREARAADVLQPLRPHVDDEADRVLRQLRVAPVGDRGLREGLVGVGRGGLVLGAAHDDAVVGLAHDVQQHVGVLILRSLGAIALRIGVGGDVERILALGAQDVTLDVARPLRVDLVQHRLAVEQRPHLADRLVADARDERRRARRRRRRPCAAWRASARACAGAASRSRCARRRRPRTT